MYQDLNKTTVIDYIKSQTKLFPQDAVLQVYEIGEGEDDGDGFINFLYRVWQDGGLSVIVKQAKTYYKALGNAKGPFVLQRNAMEAGLMRLKGAITPEYIPKIYHLDTENHLYICEDCGDLGILRFEWMKGHSFPRFPEMIGEFVAKSNFYTSEIYLEPEAHKAIQVKYMNPQMRIVFEKGLFLKDEHAIEGHDPHENPQADPVRVDMGDAVWKSRAFRIEMLKLRHIHMKKSECLVHGDLHTSNIMIGPDAMKIIDMEYSYVGASSSDSGYLLGSILYEYIRWFYMTDQPEALGAAMRAEILDAIRGMVETYRRCYTEYWQKDARETYRDYPEYCDYVLDTWFTETVGFTGCQIISRVGGMVPLPDYDTIPDQADRYEACRITLMIANYLIMHREEITDVDALIAIIVSMTEKGRKLFGRLRD